MVTCSTGGYLFAAVIMSAPLWIGWVIDKIACWDLDRRETKRG